MLLIDLRITENIYERIENVTARNIRSYNMRYGVYMKTWTGVSTGYPPNGGGAGLGYASNMTFSNLTLYNKSGIFAITQCTSYNSASGGCDTSRKYRLFSSPRHPLSLHSALLDSH